MISPSAVVATATGETSSTLLRQNQELRSRLQEEQSNYRRRLDTYKQAQQNQATLVSRLQSKVMQYKQRCNELENQIPLPIAMPSASSSFMRPTTTEPLRAIQSPPPSSPFDHHHHHHHDSSSVAPLSLPCAASSSAAYDHRASAAAVAASAPAPPTVHHVHHDHGAELDDLSRRLDDEKRRCEELCAQNTVLRQQLEESHHVNESLTQDLQKLSTDWEVLRDDMVIKENEWKEEEQVSF